ncbi:TPA: RICIN domain-containing protein [Bacillus cereus]
MVNKNPDENGIYQNRFYKIKSVAFNKVLANTQSKNDDVFLYDDLETEDQKWLFVLLDDQTYRIINKDSGKTLAIDPPRDENAFLFRHLPTPDQHWSIEQVSGYIKLRNVSNYKVLASKLKNGQVFVWEDLDTQDQLWELIPVETFTLPEIPNTFQKLGPSPSYSAPNDAFEKDTVKVLVGSTLIPYFAVNDNSLSPSTQIKNNPYYVMEHYQDWRFLDEKTLAPGGEETLTLHTGMRQTDQETITQKSGITIAADAGFNFPIVPAGRADGPFPTVTGDLKTTITNELDVSESHTSERMQDITQTQTVHNPFEMQLQYAKFAINDTYVLKRGNGTRVYEVSSIDTTSIKGASYPQGKEPSSESAQIINSRNAVTNPVSNLRKCKCNFNCTSR